MSIERRLKEQNKNAFKASVKYKQQAAEHFLQFAQQPKYASQLCEYSLDALRNLLVCDDNETRCLAARAIAVLSVNEPNRPPICESKIPRDLFESLRQHTEESVLEGCLAALTQLFEDGIYLSLVPSHVLSSKTVVKLLHHKCSGVQVNALALLINLVQETQNKHLLIESGVLETLFNLRHENFGSDVRDNSKILLQQLGYNDADPRPEHQIVNDQLRGMGFTDGSIDLARKITGSNDPQVLINFITEKKPSIPRPEKNVKTNGSSRRASGGASHRNHGASRNIQIPRKPNLNLKRPSFNKNHSVPTHRSVARIKHNRDFTHRRSRSGSLGDSSYPSGNYSTDDSDHESSPVYSWDDEAWDEIVFDLMKEGHKLQSIHEALKASHGDAQNTKHFLHLMEIFPDLHSRIIKLALEKSQWNLHQAVTLLTDNQFTSLWSRRVGSGSKGLGGLRRDSGNSNRSGGGGDEEKDPNGYFDHPDSDPDLTEFLTGIGLQKHIATFADEKITLSVLKSSPDLVRKMLIDLDVRLGDITKIQEALRRKSINQSIHIGILVSNPLTALDQPGPSKQLGFAAEKKILKEAFEESSRRLKVRFAVATENNLLSLIQLGARVLHYSGHGKAKGSLLLENERGGEYDLKVQSLKRAMEATKDIKLRFVLVSSCFSSQAARAFVDAGVPHVIAVDQDSRIKDSTALQFARHVYKSLARGETVQKAFDNGRAGIIISDSRPPCCCAHLHKETCRTCRTCGAHLCCEDKHHTRFRCHESMVCCSPELPHDEHDKFLLLPKETDHHESILEDVPVGEWENITPPLPPTNLKVLPDEFQGRARDVKAVVELITKVRLATIAGPKGQGCTSVARAAGWYLNERSVFRDGIFEIYLDQCLSTIDVAKSIAKSLQIEFKTDKQLISDVCKKSMLLIFDSVWDCQRDAEFFQVFLERFFQKTKSIKVLCTAKSIAASAPMVAGVNQKIHSLKSLHPVDAAFLLYARLTRPFPKDNDFPSGSVKPRNRQEMAQLPIFSSFLHGNPALIEKCSDLLTHMTYSDLITLLDETDHSKWVPPHNLSPGVVERVKQFQRECNSLGKLIIEHLPAR